MHTPPCETMGDAVTRWSVMRPSSPIAHRRWKNISKRMGSIAFMKNLWLFFLSRSLDFFEQRSVDEILRLRLARFGLALGDEIERRANAFERWVGKRLEERRGHVVAVVENFRVVRQHVFGERLRRERLVAFYPLHRRLVGEIGRA